MYNVFKSTLYSLFIFCSLFTYTHAQNVPGISDPISYQTIPEYPQPRENVSIKAQSFSTDLNKAVFRWFVDDKLYAQGVGLREINITTGKPGSFTVINVEIQTSDFGTFKNTFSFRPAEVTLLYEADTYTPPFYLGKALHSFNGAFKVTAIPEFFDIKGKRINPKDLIYTWKKNGDVVGDASGFGKDSLITSQTSYLRDGESINVEVSSPRENLAGTAWITLKPTVPEIVFYENSPLYGLVYEKAFQNSHNLKGEELTLRAEVFNASIGNPLDGSLDISWIMNGLRIPEFANKNDIVLRKVSEDGGQSEISVQIQHREKLLQGGKNSLTIFQ